MPQRKYLGVIFDDKLNCKPHIQHLCSKLSCASWALLKLKNYVNVFYFKNGLLQFGILSYIILHNHVAKMPWIHQKNFIIELFESFPKVIIRLIPCPFSMTYIYSKSRIFAILNLQKACTKLPKMFITLLKLNSTSPHILTTCDMQLNNISIFHFQKAI